MATAENYLGQRLINPQYQSVRAYRPISGSIETKIKGQRYGIERKLTEQERAEMQIDIEIFKGGIPRDSEKPKAFETIAKSTELKISRDLKPIFELNLMTDPRVQIDERNEGKLRYWYDAKTPPELLLEQHSA